MSQLTEKDLKEILAKAGILPMDDSFKIKIFTDPQPTKSKTTTKVEDVSVKPERPIPVFSGLRRDSTLVKNCVVSLNSNTKKDWIANLNAGDPLAFYIDVTGVDYVSVKPENLLATSEYLKDLYNDIKKHTTYFEPPVEMSLKDIEEALGYRIKLV